MSFIQVPGSGSNPESLTSSFTWTSPADQNPTIGSGVTVDRTGFWVSVFVGDFNMVDAEPGSTANLLWNGSVVDTHSNDVTGSGGGGTVHVGLFNAGVINSGQTIQVQVATGSNNSSVSLSGTLYAYFVPTPTYRR